MPQRVARREMLTGAAPGCGSGLFHLRCLRHALRTRPRLAFRTGPNALAIIRLQVVSRTGEGPDL